MACRQVSTFSGVSASSGGYTTEAECLQACKEGACCEGTTCTVKPQCQCQGTGETFKGVGTTCSPNPCECYCSGSTIKQPSSVSVTISGTGGGGTGVYYRGGGPNPVTSSATYTLPRTSCGLWQLSIPTPQNLLLLCDTCSGTSLLRFSLNEYTNELYFEIVVLHVVSGINIASYSYWGLFASNSESQHAFPEDALCAGEAITGILSVTQPGSDIVMVMANPLP